MRLIQVFLKIKVHNGSPAQACLLLGSAAQMSDVAHGPLDLALRTTIVEVVIKIVEKTVKIYHVSFNGF